MRKIKYVFLLFLVFFFYGCKEELIPDWAVQTDIMEYNLSVGQETPIIFTVHSYYEEKKIIFESKNSLVADVQNGFIMAKSTGTTIIKVYVEECPEHYIEISVAVTIDDGDIPEYVLNWVKDEIGTELWLPKLFPTSHPQYDVEIEYESENEDVLTNMGIISPKEADVSVDLKITVRYKTFIISDTCTVIIVGYAFSITANDFFSQLPKHGKIMDSYIIDTTGEMFEFSDITLSWASSDEKVFTNAGVYKKPFDDTNFEVILTMVWVEKGITKTYSKSFTALGVSISEKGETVKTWLEANEYVPKLATNNLVLPLYYDDEFNADLEWSVDDANVVDADGKITPRKIDSLIILTCKVSTGGKSINIYFNVEIPAKDYVDKWEAIEAFLDEIFLNKIKTQKYYMNGIVAAFPAYNYGYIPFYEQTPSDVTVDILLSGHAMRPGGVYERKYVVIHDTANNTPNAGALMHNNYLKDLYSGGRKASWHYSVDDIAIYQHIPDMEEAWHAGTGEGNRHGIGIETCVNPEVDYTVVMRRTAKLTAELLYKHSLTLKDIKQHYDFTQKDCPNVMRHSNRWGEFLFLTAIEYTGLKNFSDVSFSWESLNKNIMDNTGKVHNHPGIETQVTYKVTVSYNGESKEYTHTSTLLPPSWS